MRLLVAAVALATGLMQGAVAQPVPPAPQSTTSQDGKDGPGIVSLPPGTNGPIDVWGICRWVTARETTVEVFDVSTAQAWESVQKGVWDGRVDPGVALAVCCRPKSVTLCQGAAGGTVSETLPYTIYGQAKTETATCIDAWGKTYTDTQQWTCDEIGSGVTEDGLWIENGSDSYVCSPNAYTSACTASCGGGTQTTWDSCGNVTAVDACNTQACCTTDYVKSCSGSTAIYTDEGTCHGGSYSVPNGCTYESYSCSASCSSSYGDILGPEADGCTYNYYDCWADGNWAPPPGGTDCHATSTWCEPVQVSGCQNPANNGSKQSCGAVIAVSCTCGDWQ